MTTVSPSALWYLSRGTGVVSLLLLTAVLVLGVLGVARWRSERAPRFLVQGLHKNLTLLSIAFVGIHVVTTVADGFAPIALTDAVIPFASPYRPVWLGLGTVAFDLLLALTVTSLLRARVGLRTWKALHWLAYASWPVALLHSFGTGSDARVSWLVLLGAACTLAVAAAALWRALAGRESLDAIRVGAAAAAVVVPLGLVVWYRSGPGAPGWAGRAGTPAYLLGARVAVRTQATLPAPPFSGGLTGTIAQSRPDSSGLVTVQVNAVSGGERLGVWLRGEPLDGGGVSVQDSRMWLGTAATPELYVGTLDALQGAQMHAVLRSAGGSRLAVTLVLNIDRARGTVTGTFHAGAAA